MKSLVTITLAAAIGGCASPGLHVSRVGSFEVGRLPGDVIGGYAALTTNSNKDLFGRTCVMGGCGWMLVLNKGECEKDQKVSAILSIDGRATAQDMACGSKGIYLVGEVGNDSTLSASILASKQVGVTLPDGRSAVFDTRGAEAALARLADRMR